jgi:hypothetical protein
LGYHVLDSAHSTLEDSNRAELYTMLE